MLIEDRVIDIFVGSKIGSFKHIKYYSDSTLNSKKNIENLVDVKSLEKGDGIKCMCWADEEQTEVVIGRDNQQIQTYSMESSSFTRTYDSPGPLAGVGRGAGGVVSATRDGVVSVWASERADIAVGGNVECMKVCEQDRSLYAVGGKEFDVKLYRLGCDAPVFCSKNVRHDSLELRREIWASDLVHTAPGAEVAVVSPLGYIRLYDVRAQRRPVCEVTSGDKLAATAVTNDVRDRQVVVGFNRGHLHVVDFRNKRLDKGFKGAVGAVTGVSVASGLRPTVVSVSLDRHVRAHDYLTKECVYKQYLTSKLTCVLVQTCPAPLERPAPRPADVADPPPDDLDRLFDDMEEVSCRSGRKRASCQPSTDGATDTSLSQEERDSAIVRLLKSTERKKRRTEKQKREKKKKSVFFNA